MKKLLLLFTLGLCCLTFSSPIQDHTIDQTAVSDLATALDISQDPSDLDGTLNQWLIKAHPEKWLEQAKLSTDQISFMLNWSQEQGMFSTWNPFNQTYDTALILGNKTSNMQNRLNFLIQLWEAGLRFNEIIWLTTDRRLYIKLDDFTDLCSTESEAAHIIWEEATLPVDMQSLPVTFIAVPIIQNGNTLKIPDTNDMIQAWLNTSPQPCSALFVTNQPFCGYQFACIKSSLSTLFQFDVIGTGIESADQPAAAFKTLENIALWNYQQTINTASENP